MKHLNRNSLIQVTSAREFTNNLKSSFEYLENIVNSLSFGKPVFTTCFEQREGILEPI